MAYCSEDNSMRVRFVSTDYTDPASPLGSHMPLANSGSALPGTDGAP